MRRILKILLWTLAYALAGLVGALFLLTVYAVLTGIIDLLWGKG